MKKSILIIALSTLVAAPAFAQHPAGTPEDREGSSSSTMGNPAPQETVETQKDHKGRTVTEDGRPVAQPDNGDDGDADSKDPTRHTSPGGVSDPASDPGSLE